MERYQASKKAGIIGILGNVFLLFIKALVGFASRSQAMIADAANSAGDIFASLMTAIGSKIASAPQDSNHNFGHGKAEYIFSFFISLSMIVVALKLFYDSIISLITMQTINFSWWLILICIITILVKLALYFYTSHLCKKYSNILLESNKKDHRNDCIVTFFTLISILLSLKGIYWFDGIVGMGISLWICFTGITIFIESYNVLMDISIDKTYVDSILSFINKHSEIRGVDKISSIPIGYQYVIVLTIYVDGNISTFESHHLADSLEKEICTLDKVHNAIIHVNPV